MVGCECWSWWSGVQSLNFAPNPSPSVPETQWAGSYHSASSGSYNYKPQPVRHHQQQLQLHIWPQSAIYLTVTLPLSWSGSQLKLIRRNAEAREITQQTEYIFYWIRKQLNFHLSQGYIINKFKVWPIIWIWSLMLRLALHYCVSPTLKFNLKCWLQ